MMYRWRVCVLGVIICSIPTVWCRECQLDPPVNLTAGRYTDFMYGPRNFNSSSVNQCHWLITAELDGHVINITVYSLLISYRHPCPDEHIIVYDGPTPEDRVLARVCPQLHEDPKLTSTSRVIRVYYYAKGPMYNSHFRLSYKAIEDPDKGWSILSIAVLTAALVAVLTMFCVFCWLRHHTPACCRRPTNSTSAQQTTVFTLPFRTLSGGVASPGAGGLGVSAVGGGFGGDSLGPPRYSDLSFTNGGFVLEDTDTAVGNGVQANPGSRGDLLAPPADPDVTGESPPPSYSQSQLVRSCDHSHPATQEMTSPRWGSTDGTQRPRVSFSLLSAPGEEGGGGRGAGGEAPRYSEAGLTPAPRYDDAMLLSYPPEQLDDAAHASRQDTRQETVTMTTRL